MLYAEPVIATSVNIGKVGSHLTKDADITLIHAFVASMLDHMNALLYKTPEVHIDSCCNN